MILVLICFALSKVVCVCSRTVLVLFKNVCNIRYLLVLIVRERKHRAHARSTYKERSLICRIYILIIVSRILFVVVDWIYLFISKDFYSGLNF